MKRINANRRLYKMAKEDLGEVAERTYRTFSGLPKEEQRRVAYRLNWMVKKLFNPAKPRAPKVVKEKKSKK